MLLQLRILHVSNSHLTKELHYTYFRGHLDVTKSFIKPPLAQTCKSVSQNWAYSEFWQKISFQRLFFRLYKEWENSITNFEKYGKNVCKSHNFRVNMFLSLNNNKPFTSIQKVVQQHKFSKEKFCYLKISSIQRKWIPQEWKLSCQTFNLFLPEKMISQIQFCWQNSAIWEFCLCKIRV